MWLLYTRRLISCLSKSGHWNRHSFVIFTVACAAFLCATKMVTCHSVLSFRKRWIFGALCLSCCVTFFVVIRVLKEERITCQIDPIEPRLTLRKPGQEVLVFSPLCNCTRYIPVANDSTATPSGGAGQFPWCSEDSHLRGSHQRVVAYSLFGDARRPRSYCRYYSLLRHISTRVEEEYPGWVIRIYHSFNDDDDDARRSLCDIYCRFPHVDICSVRNMWQRIGDAKRPIDAKILQGLNQRMYRYLVALDADVDVFVSRDIDSLILRREVDAVNEWLRSNFTFHLMRDSIHHDIIMLAGDDQNSSAP